MEKQGWKVLAIVAISIIILECVLLGYIYYIGGVELDKQNRCFYDICGDAPEAEYYEDVCYCYDYDVMGQLTLNRTKYMD